MVSVVYGSGRWRWLKTVSAFKAKWLIKLDPYKDDPDIAYIIERVRKFRSIGLGNFAETVIHIYERSEGEKRRILEELIRDLEELAERMV